MAPGSFINVLIHMPGFCPTAAPELSVDEEHFGCRFATNFYKACPDLCDAQHMRCQASPHECIGSRYPEPRPLRRTFRWGVHTKAWPLKGSGWNFAGYQPHSSAVGLTYILTLKFM